ncbi:hypothetical protein J3D56_004116 [Erwinia persicina]|nr:hypothetical protein [Erwinia persicina]
MPEGGNVSTLYSFSINVQYLKSLGRIFLQKMLF